MSAALTETCPPLGTGWCAASTFVVTQSLPQEQRCLTFPSRTRSFVAAALFVAGVTGTVVDPDGTIRDHAVRCRSCWPVAYLLARPAQRSFRRLAATWRAAAGTVHGVVRGRTVAVVVTAMAVLFGLWLAADLARPLVYAFWSSFIILTAWLVAVTRADCAAIGPNGPLALPISRLRPQDERTSDVPLNSQPSPWYVRRAGI